MAVAPLYDPCDDFELLYRRYARRVYCYALAVLRNPADAEDVTQTTFLNAFRAMRNGTEPELPENWLLRIAHNTCRTRFLRAARRPQEVPFDDSVRQLAVPDDEKPNLDEVLRALSRLPFNQRSALVLRELEGRSYEEIAEALGVTVSSVEALLFRARRTLRLRRNALRVLGLVQLPPSLEALVAGGAATTGGTVVGGGALLKLATFVAAALTAGGAGYETIQAYAVQRPVAAAAPAGLSASAQAGQGTGQGTGRTVAARRGVTAIAPGAPGRVSAARAQQARTVRPAPGAPGATVNVLPSSPGAGGGTKQPSAPSPTAPSAPGPTAPAPQAPSAPTAPIPQPTVPSAPQVPTVPAPSLPPAPALPPPPALPPVPPAPTLPPPPALPPPPQLPPPPDLPKLP